MAQPDPIKKFSNLIYLHRWNELHALVVSTPSLQTIKSWGERTHRERILNELAKRGFIPCDFDANDDDIDPQCYKKLCCDSCKQKISSNIYPPPQPIHATCARNYHLLYNKYKDFLWEEVGYRVALRLRSDELISIASQDGCVIQLEASFEAMCWLAESAPNTPRRDLFVAWKPKFEMEVKKFLDAPSEYCFRDHTIAYFRFWKPEWLHQINPTMMDLFASKDLLCRYDNPIVLRDWIQHTNYLGGLTEETIDTAQDPQSIYIRRFYRLQSGIILNSRSAWYENGYIIALKYADPTLIRMANEDKCCQAKLPHITITEEMWKCASEIEFSFGKNDINTNELYYNLMRQATLHNAVTNYPYIDKFDLAVEHNDPELALKFIENNRSIDNDSNFKGASIFGDKWIKRACEVALLGANFDLFKCLWTPNISISFRDLSVDCDSIIWIHRLGYVFTSDDRDIIRIRYGDYNGYQQHGLTARNNILRIGKQRIMWNAVGVIDCETCARRKQALLAFTYILHPRCGQQVHPALTRDVVEKIIRM